LPEKDQLVRTKHANEEKKRRPVKERKKSKKELIRKPEKEGDRPHVATGHDETRTKRK